MKIGIFGSAVSEDEDVMRKAEIIGREIAKKGHSLVTGACGGLPHLAAKGAFSEGSSTIAFTPANNIDEHVNIYKFPLEFHSKYEFTPKDYSSNKGIALKFRNVMSCGSVDAGIIIGGRIGTLNEFTNLYDMGKIIGVLSGSGGISSQVDEIVKKAAKKTDSVIVFDDNPVRLVEKIIGCWYD